MRSVILLLLSLLSVVACGPGGGTEPNLASEGGFLQVGSKFEIDNDANTIVDAEGNYDWNNVYESRQDDLESGRNDNSYSGGAKENDLCPSVGTGSIPNNKSDLKSFGVWREPGTSFLHMYWTRVQEPSGTTLIDFEFNQSSETCENGVNPIRTVGDLLIEYRIEQGGSTATIKIRFWDGVGWGPETDLTATGSAVGTINQSFIPATESDGLGDLSPYTFGELTLDLDFVFQGIQCINFGSVFVKSRSSDSFTSALKDFIAPKDVSISNCGSITINKVTIPSGVSETFTFEHNLSTDPAQESNVFTLGDQGKVEFNNVFLGSYTITEQPTSGYDLVDVYCDEPPVQSTVLLLKSVSDSGADAGTEPVNNKLQINIESEFDNYNCTFINRKRLGYLRVEKTRYHAADGPGKHAHAGVVFSVAGDALNGTVDLTTDSDGVACLEVPWGDYMVTETVPDGYAYVSPKVVSVNAYATDCNDGQIVKFNNTPLTNLMCKVDSQVDGGTSSTLDCTGAELVETGSSGDGTVSLNSVLPGIYTCVLTVQ